MGEVDDGSGEEWGDRYAVADVSHDDTESAPPSIRAHQSDGSRTVFTESGNSDAWIVTDFVVTPRR